MTDERTAEQHLAEADRLSRDWAPVPGGDMIADLKTLAYAQWHLLRAQILREPPTGEITTFVPADVVNGIPHRPALDCDGGVATGYCTCGDLWPHIRFT